HLAGQLPGGPDQPLPPDRRRLRSRRPLLRREPARGRLLCPGPSHLRVADAGPGPALGRAVEPGIPEAEPGRVPDGGHPGRPLDVAAAAWTWLGARRPRTHARPR